MVKRAILTALLFISVAGIFGAPLQPAYAACTAPQTFQSSCSGTSPVKCAVGRPGQGGTFMCCGTETECTTFAQSKGLKTTVQSNTICDYAGTNKGACQGCMGGNNATWTAFGCIHTDPQQFIGEMLRIGIGIGGGLAFLLILFGGFQILTSAGNPEQLNGGRELVSSAITGLLLIIFSIFLLRLIGYNIFGIPGFG